MTTEPKYSNQVSQALFFRRWYAGLSIFVVFVLLTFQWAMAEDIHSGQVLVSTAAMEMGADTPPPQNFPLDFDYLERTNDSSSTVGAECKKTNSDCGIGSLIVNLDAGGVLKLLYVVSPSGEQSIVLFTSLRRLEFPVKQTIIPSITVEDWAPGVQIDSRDTQNTRKIKVRSGDNILTVYIEGSILHENSGLIINESGVVNGKVDSLYRSSIVVEYKWGVL